MINLKLKDIKQYEDRISFFANEFKNRLQQEFNIEKFDLDIIRSIEDYFEPFIVKTNEELFKIMGIARLLGNCSDIVDNIEQFLDIIDENDYISYNSEYGYVLRTGMGVTRFDNSKKEDYEKYTRNVDDLFEFLIEVQTISQELGKKLLSFNKQ